MTAEEVRSLSKPFETVMDVTEMEKPMVMASARLVGVPVFSFLPTPFNLARLTKHFAHISKDDNVRLFFHYFLPLPTLSIQLTDVFCPTSSWRFSELTSI